MQSLCPHPEPLLQSAKKPTLILWGNSTFEWFNTLIMPGSLQKGERHTVLKINNDVEWNVFTVPHPEWLRRGASQEQLNALLPIFRKISNCSTDLEFFLLI